jgi:hypothetical protein
MVKTVICVLALVTASIIIGASSITTYAAKPDTNTIFEVYGETFFPTNPVCGISEISGKVDFVWTVTTWDNGKYKEVIDIVKYFYDSTTSELVGITESHSIEIKTSPPNSNGADTGSAKSILKCTNGAKNEVTTTGWTQTPNGVFIEHGNSSN